MKLTKGYYLLEKFNNNGVYYRVVDIQTCKIRVITEQDFMACSNRYNDGTVRDYLMPGNYVVSRNFAGYIDEASNRVKYWYLGYTYDMPIKIERFLDYNLLYWYLTDDYKELRLVSFFKEYFSIDIRTHILMEEMFGGRQQRYKGVPQTFTSFLSGILLN